MKTTVGMEEVSSHPAQGIGWAMKIDGGPGRGTEKQGIGIAKWLAKASDGDNRGNDPQNSIWRHEQQVKWEIPA